MRCCREELLLHSGTELRQLRLMWHSEETNRVLLGITSCEQAQVDLLPPLFLAHSNSSCCTWDSVLISKNPSVLCPAASLCFCDTAKLLWNGPVCAMEECAVSHCSASQNGPVVSKGWGQTTWKNHGITRLEKISELIQSQPTTNIFPLKHVP